MATETLGLPLADGSGYPWRVLCPVCRFDYTHFAPDDVHVEATDDYTSPIGNRGSWIAVPMWCEEGHSWRLVIGFHKGQTFLDTVPDGRDHL